MSRSVLLQLTRDSIQEVIEAQRFVDRQLLLSKYPLLSENITTSVKIYLDHKLRGEYSSMTSEKSLLEDIVYNAKKAAFEDKNFTPLTTAEYLDCEIELSLKTPDGVISEKDEAILKGHITEQPVKLD